MMTSQVLRALEGKGLVERSAHPTDARARALTVTPDGARLANDANSAVEAADRRFFGTLAGEQRAFAALLGRLSVSRG
jgi:DNA-binding MarR family transcriptional regulator